MDSQRVVITGIGAISAIGKSADQNWNNAINGISGVGPLTQFDASNFLVKIACEVKDFTPDDYMPSKEARRRDRFEQFAAVAADEALRQSGITEYKMNPDRIGVFISSAIGGLNILQESISIVNTDGPRKISPFAIPMLMSNGAAGLVAIDYGFQGPCYSICSACASGADGIGIGMIMIKSGLIDAAVVGGSEATITPVGVAAFDRVGALSRRNEDYSMTPQPFDRNRDGLVMGEGAAVLVLESEQHARKRGVTILAELAGYGSTADAYHITAPAEDGDGGARAIRQALYSSGLNFVDVDYINAHGTATVLNDLAETRAIKSAFGDMAYKIPISSTKSMTGHMMGATGAVEAVFCVYIVRENILPPTIHYETPDPECDLDYIPNNAREKIVNVVISNSFGFGGHNAVLAIKKYV